METAHVVVIGAGANGTVLPFTWQKPVFGTFAHFRDNSIPHMLFKDNFIPQVPDLIPRLQFDKLYPSNNVLHSRKVFTLRFIGSNPLTKFYTYVGLYTFPCITVW